MLNKIREWLRGPEGKTGPMGPVGIGMEGPMGAIGPRGRNAGESEDDYTSYLNDFYDRATPHNPYGAYPNKKKP